MPKTPPKSSNDDTDTIEILTREGKPWRVNRAKYESTRAALMQVLPSGPPGIPFSQVQAAVLPLLDPELFPGGAKSGWWLKSVQLDHEARGLVQRTPGSPLRFYRT